MFLISQRYLFYALFFLPFAICSLCVHKINTHAYIRTSTILCVCVWRLVLYADVCVNDASSAVQVLFLPTTVIS